ncbi:MAG: hypothetical protein HWE20_15680 [Gammaproteobacteria bacterium]|nr:hypothetical protein [Gammaproteobacteria bacterium]
MLLATLNTQADTRFSVALGQARSNWSSAPLAQALEDLNYNASGFTTSSSRSSAAFKIATDVSPTQAITASIVNYGETEVSYRINGGQLSLEDANDVAQFHPSSAQGFVLSFDQVLYDQNTLKLSFENGVVLWNAIFDVIAKSGTVTHAERGVGISTGLKISKTFGCGQSVGLKLATDYVAQQWIKTGKIEWSLPLTGSDSNC